MYIQNIRDAIFNLSDEEEKIFLKKLRNILKFQYGKDVRPKTLKGRVLKFVHGTKPNSDYLEAYLLTFDEIKQNGAVNALQGEKLISHKPGGIYYSFLVMLNHCPRI